MYESGTSGLLPASFLNSIGANTEATLVRMHPGNVPQKQAMKEQLTRCISVNLYSVLREYYQEKDQQPSSKKQKLSEDDAETSGATSSTVTTTAASPNSDSTGDYSETNNPSATVPAAPAQKWQIENRRACELMRVNFDALVIAAKEHPSNIVQALLHFVKPSRPIVLYSLSKELLMDLYVELKTNSNVTNLHFTWNWLRYYQILPNRTHPEVNMNGNSGYLLTGYNIG
ncbi:tRNA (adenine(58)-N(1))-methyltransferase non-catalytic subunit TRM6-like [Eurosta solidaginis]|uniref:tRNA (adenine(58)-N(1))-methyltransferase non-catalytic subunit TRM6-like n=1 Tax=Eurosta solidaginis TaxID=178769 RepID=UPI0035313438